MCYGKDTQITILQGQTLVQDLLLGDPLQAAILNGNTLSWQPARVGLGQQSDAGQSMMVYLIFENSQQMVTSVDQLFLLSTGQLMRADKLAPGTNQLMDSDGNPVNLSRVSLGVFGETLFQLATNKPYSGSIDGHLLLSNGVVTGDYILQVNTEDLIAKGIIMADRHVLPRV